MPFPTIVRARPESCVERIWRYQRHQGIWDYIEEFEDDFQYTSIDLNENIYKVIRRLTHQLPGFNFDFPGLESSFQQTLDLSHDPANLRFISSQQPLNKFLDYLNRIGSYQDNSEYELKQVIEKVKWPKHLLQRWVWSLDDLRKGGFGFTLELFLVSLKQKLSTHTSHNSYSALYIGTFRAITSWWRQCGRSNYYVGSHYILLDIVASDQGFLRTFNYPDYITDGVWELLGDMFEGQADRHINIALEKLSDLQHEGDSRLGARASALSLRLRIAYLQGPNALTDSE